MTDNTKAFSTQSQWSRLLHLYFISTCIFVATYLIYNLVYNFTTALVSSHYLIPTIVYYFGTYFDIPAFYWNQPNVIMTFSSGPIACFFMSLFSLRMFMIYRRSKSWLRLAFLWAYHHGFNLFFGAFVAGVISRSGFRHASNWAAIPEGVEYFLAVGAMVCMFLVGFLSVKFFLQTAISQSLIEKEQRIKFISFVLLLPWLTGSFIICALKMPNLVFYELLVFLMMFTSVVPVFIAHRFYYEVNIMRWDANLSINWGAFVMLVLFLVSFRIVLEMGILIKTTPKFTVELFNREPQFR